MNEELETAFDQLEADTDIRAVVLTGAGRAFCAGAVLDDLLSAGNEKGGDGGNLPHIYRGFLRVAHSSLPTVAAVNGAAVGAGVGLRDGAFVGIGVVGRAVGHVVGHAVGNLDGYHVDGKPLGNCTLESGWC